MSKDTKFVLTVTFVVGIMLAFFALAWTISDEGKDPEPVTTNVSTTPEPEESRLDSTLKEKQHVDLTGVRLVQYTAAVEEAKLVAYVEAIEHAQWHEEQERLAAAQKAEDEQRAREQSATQQTAVEAPPAPSGNVWDAIAECESGGNWQINTGNGYYGGLQMNMQFWISYGGKAYAEYPHQTSRETQIMIAERARDGYNGHAARGYGPWPNCGAPYP